MTPPPKPPWRRTIQYTWRVVSAIGVIVGLWIGAREFSPRLVVEQDVVLYPGNPLLTQFRVTNVGRFPIYQLRFLCSYRPPEVADTDDANARTFPFTFPDIHGPIGVNFVRRPELAPGEATSTNCMQTQVVVEDETELEVMAIYKPYGWPFGFRDQTWKFMTIKDSTGVRRLVPTK